MRLTTFAACATAAILAFAPMAPARAAQIDFFVLPPKVEEQNLCGPRAIEEVQDFDTGRDDELTVEERILFLRRDIRRLQAEAPDRYFDFIGELITRLSEQEPEFAGVDAWIARIELHIDAGRFDELDRSGLVTRLAASRETLNLVQTMQLAHLYLTGTGVARDEDIALRLIREAAFGGHANALLFIAGRLSEGGDFPDWDAPLDLTVSMAFGGLLGQMDGRVCGRAERIAEEFLQGGIVRRNEAAAYAWFRFAADLGSARAAWRVVEFHLGADAPEQDNDVMMYYLRRAVVRGIALDDSATGALAKQGGIDAETLSEILAFNQSADRGRRRPSLSHLFELDVNVDDIEASTDSAFLQYLQELAALPHAPGFVFTDLAKEVQVRRGRWAGEAEAIEHLREATRRGDPEGMRLLAERLLRYRDEPKILNRAVDLLTRAVSLHDDAEAMRALDALFRCQAPDAPRLREANDWARSYAATGHATVGISATDLLAIDPYNDPWTLAKIQTQALGGRITSLANYLQLIQVDPLASDARQRLWSDRADNSDKTMEEFAELEFELATNPAERRLAVELFRRVYLNNGVTTALDLSIALTEDNSRDAAIAAEIVTMLTQAGNRGEGASIRLLARLQAAERPERAIFEQFEQVIEDRGDFLAMMFALPHVAAEKREDYFDRAVSQMVCGTKDVAELGEARAILDHMELSFHWRRISLIIEGGNVLSKLRLSDEQMAAYDTGAAPDAATVLSRDHGGALAAEWRLLHLTGNPDLEGFAAERAARHFANVLAAPDMAGRAFEFYLTAPPALRRAIDDEVGYARAVDRAAKSGMPDALWRQARLMRDTARTAQELAAATEALARAAEAGAIPALGAYGRALALGDGVERDLTEALEWLDKAAIAGDGTAAGLARRLRLR